MCCRQPLLQTSVPTKFWAIQPHPPSDHKVHITTNPSAHLTSANASALSFSSCAALSAPCAAARRCCSRRCSIRDSLWSAISPATSSDSSALSLLAAPLGFRALGVRVMALGGSAGVSGPVIAMAQQDVSIAVSYVPNCMPSFWYVWLVQKIDTLLEGTLHRGNSMLDTHDADAAHVHCQ